ncbi:hypothetical protein [Providencia hangzhouensis]|uniref:hypothetical protein n=1 Tax=Providencia hangzhouensis TaxID=3031799 RepID=UPI0034DD5BA5
MNNFRQEIGGNGLSFLTTYQNECLFLAVPDDLMGLVQLMLFINGILKVPPEPPD